MNILDRYKKYSAVTHYAVGVLENLDDDGVDITIEISKDGNKTRTIGYVYDRDLYDKMVANDTYSKHKYDLIGQSILYFESTEEGPDLIA